MTREDGNNQVALSDDIDRFEIECAVWHPSLPASSIAQVVEATPKIQWSFGELNSLTGILRDRTYCRFALGQCSQMEINTGLNVLLPFRALDDIMFHESGGSMIVYFKNTDNASELHVNVCALSVISGLRASIVFR
jgi:hypothetical protein